MLEVGGALAKAQDGCEQGKRTKEDKRKRTCLTLRSCFLASFLDRIDVMLFENATMEHNPAKQVH